MSRPFPFKNRPPYKMPPHLQHDPYLNLQHDPYLNISSNQELEFQNPDVYIQQSMEYATEALKIIDSTLDGSLSISATDNPYQKAQQAVLAAETAANHAERLTRKQNNAALAVSEAKNQARVAAADAKNKAQLNATESANRLRVSKVDRAKDAAIRSKNLLEELAYYMNA